MRIVLINWAPIREGTARGGGVNGYCQGLAAELVGRGHEVISLCGGMRFQAGDGGGPGVCRIERTEDWEGVGTYEVVNSPVLAPSLAQFRDPLGEVSAPELEDRLHEWVAQVKPDVVHWHNVEGFSAGCLGAIRRGSPRTRVFYSLHNYHTICPQVYLMQGHRRPCFSFDNGHACMDCIPAPDPREERARLMAKRAPGGKEPVRAPRLSLVRAIRTVAARISRGGAEAGWPPRFVEGRGPHPWYCEDVPAWRPLLNVVQAEPASSRAPNEYARRRAAMIGMLNGCDRVIAVSEFVRRKFESMGVNARVIRTLHIGSRMTALARSKGIDPPPPLLAPGGEPARPMRMAFMGYNNWYKGLQMLADSLDLLTPEVQSRIHLFVYALEGQQMEPQFRAMEPRLGGLTIQHGYRYGEIPRLVCGIDLGLVTSVWWDNAPQTVMEFAACGVPVLAAELGGIPDYVREGENGLLFRGNDRWDLARRLAWVTGHPRELMRLREGVHPPKGMSEHAAELERMYGERIS